jgi:hypothetical protein
MILGSKNREKTKNEAKAEVEQEGAGVSRAEKGSENDEEGRSYNARKGTSRSASKGE